MQTIRARVSQCTSTETYLGPCKVTLKSISQRFSQNNFILLSFDWKVRLVDICQKWSEYTLGLYRFATHCFISSFLCNPNEQTWLSQMFLNLHIPSNLNVTKVFHPLVGASDGLLHNLAYTTLTPVSCLEECIRMVRKFTSLTARKLWNLYSWLYGGYWNLDLLIIMLGSGWSQQKLLRGSTTKLTGSTQDPLVLKDSRSLLFCYLRWL